MLLPMKKCMEVMPISQFSPLGAPPLVGLATMRTLLFQKVVKDWRGGRGPIVEAYTDPT